MRLPSGALDRALLTCGVLLAIALTFLSWHADGPAPSHGGAPGRTSVQGPGAAAGIAAAAVTLVTVAWLAVATLPPHPKVTRPRPVVVVGLTATALALVLVKLALDTDGLARGAWYAIVLAVAFAGLGAAQYRAGRAGRVTVSSG